jgi:hypothetical protein
MSLTGDNGERMVRLDKAQSVLREMLQGNKPVLDPAADTDKAVIDILHHMGDRHDLDSPALFYYLTPAETGQQRETDKLEINTEVHPLHVELVTEAAEILGQLNKQGIANAQILGADFYNELRADNLVLSSRGAIPALLQAMSIIYEAMEHKLAVKPRTLALDNSTGRWTPLLKLLDLDSEEKRAAFNRQFINGHQAFALRVADTKADIPAVIAESGLEANKQISAAKTIFHPGIRPYLPFDTSNEIKHKDAVMAVKRNGYNVMLDHSNRVGGHSENGLEFTGSYGGNALDKLVTTLRYKIQQAPGAIERYLHELDENIDNTWLLVADGGVSFDPEVFAEPEFDGARDLVIPGMLLPGPETKPVVLRLGATGDFYGAASRVMDRLGENSRTSIDTCVWLLAPMKQDNPEKPLYFAVKASNRGTVAREPQPANDMHKIDKHYQIPEGYTKTLAELEKENDPFVWKDMAFTRALNVLLEKCGAGQRAPKLKKEFNISAVGYKVLANHQFMRGISADALADLDNQLKERGMSLLKDVASPQKLMDIRDTLYRSDGFVIMPGSRDFDFYLNGVIQTSLLVGKQLKDRHLDNKSIEYLRGDKKTRSAITRILDHLKSAGMINNYFDMYFGEKSGVADLVSSFANAARKYNRPVLESESKKIELPESGRDNVTFFFSAGTDIPEFLDDAWLASRNFARNGFGILSGMGRHSMMGVNVYAALDLKAKGHDVYVAGVQDPYAKVTEGWPIEFMDDLMGPGHALVAKDIFERIWVLSEAEKVQETGQKKVVVVQGGGIGTLQEVFCLLWMKKNLPGLDNMHIVIQNRKRRISDGTTQGVYDRLLEYIPEEDKSALNIHSCETVEQALHIAGDIYGRKLTYNHEPRTVCGYPFEKEKNPRVAELCKKTAISAPEPPPSLSL